MKKLVNQNPAELGAVAMERDPAFAEERTRVDRAMPVVQPGLPFQADRSAAGLRQAAKHGTNNWIERWFRQFITDL